MEKKFVTPCKIRTYKRTFFHFFLDYNPKYVRIYITIMNIEDYIMKAKVKIFRWNEMKNTSEIKIGYFDNSRKITGAEIVRMKEAENAIRKELTK